MATASNIDVPITSLLDRPAYNFDVATVSRTCLVGGLLYEPQDRSVGRVNNGVVVAGLPGQLSDSPTGYLCFAWLDL